MGIFQLHLIYAQKSVFTDLPLKLQNYFSKQKFSKTNKFIHHKITNAQLFDNNSINNQIDNTQLIRELLNKINDSNYNIIITQINELQFNTIEHFNLFINILLEKTIREEKFAHLYAKIIANLHILNLNLSFKQLLLQECQRIFHKNIIQANINKCDAVAFVSFLSQLYNFNVINIDTIYGFLQTLFSYVSQQDKINNNKIIDMICQIIQLSYLNLQHHIDSFQSLINDLKILTNANYVTKRQQIVIEDLLEKIC